MRDVGLCRKGLAWHMLYTRSFKHLPNSVFSECDCCMLTSSQKQRYTGSEGYANISCSNTAVATLCSQHNLEDKMVFTPATQLNKLGKASNLPTFFSVE